jgi:ABC-2 type transport system permease protein
VAGRLLGKFARQPALFLPPMLMPIFFLVAFAGGLSAIDQAPGFEYGASYTTFVFGFSLLQTAAFGGVFTGFSIAADWQSGFGRRLLLSTPHRTALLVGYAIVAMIRALVTFGVVTGVALLAGMNLPGGAGNLIAYYGLAAIVNVAGIMFAAGIALRFRSLQATPLMQVPVFLFLFLAPVYVPRDLLTGWVKAVSGFDPATHVMEAGRDLMAGQPADVLGALAITLLLVAATIVLAVRGLRSAEAAG